MKYLHVILPSKRMMNTYVKMIRDYFPEKEHTFFFLNRCVGQDRELFKYGNVIELPKGNNNLKKAYIFYKILRKHDSIIWHGLIFDFKKVFLMFFMSDVLKKSVWIIRGIDLYNYELASNNIVNKIINYINFSIRKRMKAVVAIFPTDEEVFREKISKQIPCYKIFYPIGLESFADMDCMRNAESRFDGSKWILNGNNAYTFNRHLDVLEKISKFCKENIKVIVPLSYGNDWYNIKESYKDIVITTLYKKFHDKGKAIVKLMPINEYNTLLANIDIAIINSNRQNALGNILRLLYLGSKVYLASDNPIYEYLRKEGVTVYSVNDIKNMSYKEFILTDSNNENNRKWIKNNFHPDNVWLKWGELFSCLAADKQGKYYFNNKKTEMTCVEKKNKRYIKRNYLPLRRYITYKNTGKYEDLIIVGSNDLGICLTQNIYRNNISERKYLFKGFLDCDKDKTYPVDYLDSYYDYKILQSDRFICAIDVPNKRENIIILLQSRGANFIEYIEKGVQIGTNVNMKASNVILDKSIIGPYCSMGRNNLLKGCRINSNVTIGNNVVIKNNVIVGANVHIGNNVIINESALIYDNVYLKDNTVVHAGEVIKQ